MKRHTHDKFGHKFFPVTSTDDGEMNIDLTYDDQFQIRNFYIGGTLVEGDLVSTMAAFYDTEEMRSDILEYEISEREKAEFLRDNRWPDRPAKMWA